MGMRTGTFIGTIEKGKPKIFDRAGMDAVFAAYGDGEDFQLSIEEVGRKRTQAQNRFFHGPILKAFMSTGLYQQEAKDMLCLRFIPREVRQLDGSVVLVPGHTSTLKVDEFNDLIDACIQLAAENDIFIEDADEWRKKRSAA
jgi:hypothetical protein